MRKPDLTGKHMRTTAMPNEHPVETIDEPAIRVIEHIKALDEKYAGAIAETLHKPIRVSNK